MPQTDHVHLVSVAEWRRLKREARERSRRRAARSTPDDGRRDGEGRAR